MQGLKVDQTHLVLVSGKLVLQKNVKFACLEYWSMSKSEESWQSLNKVRFPPWFVLFKYLALEIGSFLIEQLFLRQQQLWPSISKNVFANFRGTSSIFLNKTVISLLCNSHLNNIPLNLTASVRFKGVCMPKILGRHLICKTTLVKHTYTNHWHVLIMIYRHIL